MVLSYLLRLPRSEQHVAADSPGKTGQAAALQYGGCGGAGVGLKRPTSGSRLVASDLPITR